MDESPRSEKTELFVNKSVKIIEEYENPSNTSVLIFYNISENNNNYMQNYFYGTFHNASNALRAVTTLNWGPYINPNSLEDISAFPSVDNDVKISNPSSPNIKIDVTQNPLQNILMKDVVYSLPEEDDKKLSDQKEEENDKKEKGQCNKDVENKK